MGGRFLETRRGVCLDDGLLRSGFESDLLGHRGIPARIGTATSALGDNLYSDCAVALDADTGKLKWYFQFTPHDDFDYDSVQVPVLADLDWKGARRRVLLWANRNGFFYVLDRTTGEFLLGKPFAKVTWATGLDERGAADARREHGAHAERNEDLSGKLKAATNWYSPSYSPHTGLFLHSHLGQLLFGLRKGKGRVQ